MTNRTYLDANHALPHLLRKVLDRGATVESRNGRTKELMMESFTLDEPMNPYITTPGRKVSVVAQIAEMMWILKGRNDVEWLSHYLPRAAEFADDGQHWRGGYGPRLRSYRGAMDSNSCVGTVDQFAHIVKLLTEDPTTRRALFNIYDPAIDSAPGKDIPCNNWVHFLPRDGVLHAHVAIRSNDLFWGWSGINAFEWTNLLHIIAALTRLKPGSITFSISSLHLYERHWVKANTIANEMGATRWELELDEERTSPAYEPNPQFDIGGLGRGTTETLVSDFDTLLDRWFALEGQIRKGGLSSALLYQVNAFPEPLFRSWLQVLLAWHHDDVSLAKDLAGTALLAALQATPKRKVAETDVAPAPLQTRIVKPEFSPEQREEFTKFLDTLHRDKHKAYGNSWKKRGEMLGIMANMARKIDRLGVPGGGDTAADTAIDLFLYAVKYHLWLEAERHNDWQNITEGDDHADAVANLLTMMEAQRTWPLGDNEVLIAHIHPVFEELEHQVTEKREDRILKVAQLMSLSYPLALRLWLAEEREKMTKAQVRELNAVRPFNGYNV